MSVSEAFAQGAVFAEWPQSPFGSTDVVAWQFALGYGFPPRDATQANYSIGHFSIYRGIISLETQDGTLRFVGTFDAPPVKTPVDGKCSEWTGIATGNFHWALGGKRHFRRGIKAMYSQTECAISNDVYSMGWMGGGNLTVELQSEIPAK